MPARTLDGRMVGTESQSSHLRKFSARISVVLWRAGHRRTPLQILERNNSWSD
jgi:hypothetical protein